MSVFQGQSARHQLLSSVAIISVATATPALAQSKNFNIPAMPVKDAAALVARTAQVQVLVTDRAAKGRKTNRLVGEYTVEQAFQEMLKDTGLTYAKSGPQTFVIKAEAAKSVVAAPMMFAPTVAATAQPAPQYDEIIVTAQRREEKIIDVPIAMTALSSSALDERKIEGGSELLRAIPNVNFSKTNFSMYNFQIRGVGTQSISASSDPAVAVSFNSTPLVRNRLFESEFFDMERVEILRGPQGTLYGRNATAGVVNMITKLPTYDFAGELKGEVGNYKTRRVSGMLNIPIGEALGVRLAGAKTKREGFDYNTFTQRPVNGRDLWSTRATLAWEPSDRFKANIIWQHFEEDDDRLRTGKQLCTTDPGTAMVGNVAVTDVRLRGRLGQGCLPGSLYDEAAYGTPNGTSLVYLYHPYSMVLGSRRIPGTPPQNVPVLLLTEADPLAGVTQSRNLREISSNYDPKFRAKNDVFQLNLEINPSENLKFVSQTAYSRDRFYSTQDYNRFVTVPMFADSSQPGLTFSGVIPIDPVRFPGPTPGGVFCDPQLGCSDRMISADVSQSKNRQWSQEFRLQSSFDGPVNFLAGANYLNFKSQDNYYVFNNMFTLIAQYFYGRLNPPTLYPGMAFDPNCGILGFEIKECPYVDPNPIGKVNNKGHNYFLSQNGVNIRSYAAFGEMYWKINDDLKLTIGLRYTKDKKRADQIPSQLLMAGGTEQPRVDEFPDLIGNISGGNTNSGYPALDDINQSWGKFTGRIVLDWNPELSFTDHTLVYGSISRGYKGGGVNPPRVDFNPRVVQYQFLPQTFRPEFVNAFEIGTKNSFAAGRATLSASAFYYDYEDYQVSQIVDRIAFNENFNATSWGVELEAAWRPNKSFRADASLGYLKTRIGKGSQSIDVMNRTQGDTDWIVLRPWLQVPSNCIAPRAIVEKILSISQTANNAIAALCPGADRLGTWDPSRPGGISQFYNQFGITYNPLAPYNPDTVGLPVAQGGSGAPNGGRGFYANLEGNELPNAPRLTANIGGQYTIFISNSDWNVTVRSDYYRMSKSYGRVYNTNFDRLRSWDNLNASITMLNSDSGLSFQLYVKNIINKSPITGYFLNSDDTGLTTNVFTVDPRIVGFNASVKI